ncbi:SGNH/GDSL hydrolase family protein [Companilactobacillus nuruki]|uniref:Lysophospholipase n=1 Tax=Companilactobacillus nuruki TaxID=1993540 RepID=A0A2N7AW72_9LACO|nr:SGNH/GDSL hydrolase family protein [Companilactobacillus nuruki]PMD72999.1 lysophospholipase [Companilactobacillus nuruki]
MKKRYFFFCISMIFLLIFGTACTQARKQSAKRTPVKTEIKKKTKRTEETSKKMTILNSLKNSKKDSLVYYALGDSLSVGLFSNDQNDRFTTLFADDLQKGTGKTVKEVNNSSVGKTVTNFGLPNVQYLIDQQPDITTIEFGTNDSAYGTDSKNLGDFTNNLDTLISRVKSETNSKILLLTTWSPSDGKYIENDVIYDQQIKNIAKKYDVPIVDLSTIWKNNPKVTANDLGYSQVYDRQKDQFHPNQLGHQEIARLLYETVQKK